MVKILPDVRFTETYSESNFLRVHTHPRQGDESATVATIEHMFVGTSDENSSWRCELIVDEESMSKQDALFIARAYAREQCVPVIYERHDTLSDRLREDPEIGKPRSTLSESGAWRLLMRAT